MWFRIYPRSTFSNDIFQKVLTLVPLTATGPEVYVATMTIFLSDCYNSLYETLNNLKSLKIRSYLVDTVTYCCASVLVDDDCLESDITFKTEHLDYITRDFEDNTGYRFCLWSIQKYNEVTKLIIKLCLYGMEVIQPEELITYDSLLQ